MNFTKYVKLRKEKMGTVIFETLREKVFVTNETGAEILQLLEEGKIPDDIIKILENEYNSPDIKNDVISFINELKQNCIISL